MTLQSYRPMQLTVSKDSAELLVYGDICEGAHVLSSVIGEDVGTDSVEVARALMELPASVSEVTVRINSMGGDVSEGVAIYNALRGCGKRVRTVVDSFACSIASVVFMAGDERTMCESSLLMVHNPWVSVVGNAEELRRQADGLDKVAELSYAAYMRGGAPLEEVRRLMDEETILLPDECVALGLATGTEDYGGPSQRARQRVMGAFRARPPEPAREAAPAPAAQEPPQAPKAEVAVPEKKGFARMAALLAERP